MLRYLIIRHENDHGKITMLDKRITALRQGDLTVSAALQDGIERCGGPSFGLAIVA